MGSVNVNRSVSDAFYRYKMPRIMAKVEGKGNGIKTVIVNMIDVAKAIGRPATYPTKYFGCELGAQTQFDFKNDRFIVNGSHDASKLQDLLDGFIRKFVLCPGCDNPETDLIVSTKKGTISQGCKACGFHGPLEFNHKLNTFILKNPPNLNPAAQGASLTEGKRTKRSSKKVNGENGERSGSPKSEEENEIVGAPEKVAAPDEDETDWAVDVSEEAVRARLQDLTDGAKGLTITDDLEKTEKERMDLFYNSVKQRKDAGTLEQPATAKELLSEAERLEIKTKAPLVLAELLFDIKILIEIKKHRVLLLRFTHDDLRAQKYLIGGVEQVIDLHKDSLLPKVPAIFKLMYDMDILEEKALLDWGSKVSKKYVSKELSQEIHNKAEPFLTWLREAAAVLACASVRAHLFPAGLDNASAKAKTGGGECTNCVDEGPALNRWTMPLLKLGEKRYYLGIFFKANWYRAAQYCRYHGMHLASINSQEENDKLEKHIRDFGLGHEHFWTSGTDQAEEGTFFWMSTGRPVTFTNWNTGEPNNFRYENGEEEHCLELWNRDGKGLKWNDSPCSFETFFVCEVGQ